MKTTEITPLKKYDAEVFGWLCAGDVTAEEAWELMEDADHALLIETDHTAPRSAFDAIERIASEVA